MLVLRMQRGGGRPPVLQRFYRGERWTASFTLHGLFPPPGGAGLAEGCVAQLRGLHERIGLQPLNLKPVSPSAGRRGKAA
jgi:hypothetical protein